MTAELVSKPPLGARAISVQIRTAIETSSFANGDQLPTERELAEQYSASRSTIRNALDMLEKAGLVTRKVGSGTYVSYSNSNEFDVRNVIDQISPIQLIDARIGFERQMARLSVMHATKRDIELMKAIVTKMDQTENDKDEFSRLDTEFHLRLAKSTGNPLMIYLYETINEVRSHAQWSAMKNIILSPLKIRKYNIIHRAIVDGIAKRDAAAAIDGLNQHMDLARSDLLGAEDRL